MSKTGSVLDSIKTWWNEMESDEHFQPKPAKRLAIVFATNAAALSFVYFVSHYKKLEKLLPTKPN